MGVLRGEDFENWHALLDEMCRQRGWYDDGDAAGELCRLAGKTRIQDFETAKKNLRNWRTGPRIPLRRNLVLLGNMLGIKDNADLHQRWMELYREAQLGRGTDVRQAMARRQAPRRAFNGAAWAVPPIALGAVLLAGVTMFPADTVDGLPMVNFEGHVRVSSGADLLIHGAVTECGTKPPEWSQVVGELPEPLFGRLEDGGIARKVARKCGRETKVRAIRYTALQPGTETFDLLGDLIRVDVVDMRH